LAFNPTNPAGQGRAQRRSESASQSVYCGLSLRPQRRRQAVALRISRRKRSGDPQGYTAELRKGRLLLLTTTTAAGPTPRSTFHSWLSAGSCFPLQSSAERAPVRSIPTRLYTAPHHTHSTYTHLGPKQRSAFRELRFFQLSPTMCFAEWSACRCHRLLAR
jgi:hypothetical protein